VRKTSEGDLSPAARNQREVPRLFSSLSRTLKILPVAILLLLSLGALAFCFLLGISNVHYDGVAHLNIARRVFDHSQPQWNLLGTVWLPLQHLLLLPLVQSDWLWKTGMAGSLVSLLSFWLACWFLYQLALDLYQAKEWAWVTLAVFALNPNLLYLLTTPLGEMLYVAWMLGFFLYLGRFLERGRTPDLRRTAWMAALASLVRYDGWLLVLFGGGLLIWAAVRLRPGWRRFFHWLVLYGSIAGSGIFSWLLYNWLACHDPLAFLKGEYATQTRIGRILVEAGLNQFPPYHHYLMSFRYFQEASSLSAGSRLFFLGVAGFLLYAVLRFREKRWPVLLLLFLLPPLYYSHNLFRGTGIIFVPTLPPYGILNVRYTALFLPALCLFLPALGFILLGLLPALKKGAKGLSSGGRDWARICSLGMVLILTAWISNQYWKWLYMGRFGIAFWQEAYVNGLERKTAEFQTAEFLQKNFDGKPILMDVSEHGMIPQQTGLPLKSFINETEYPRWEQAIRSPETMVDWIIVQEDDSIWQALQSTKGLQEQFQPVFIGRGPFEVPIHVYRRK